jgi:nicotinamidase-related amidase
MTKYVIVIDVQSGFKSLCNKEYVQKIDDALEEYINAGYELYYTIDNHINQDLYLDTQECVQYGIHCNKDIDLIPLASRCKEQPNKHMNKNIFMAWSLCVIPEFPEEIVIFGVTSEVCVINNALYLRALFPTAPIIVREDLCKGFTQEGHDSAMNVMRACSINVVNPVN